MITSIAIHGSKASLAPRALYPEFAVPDLCEDAQYFVLRIIAGVIASLPLVQNHKDQVDGVVALAKRVQSDTDLAALIRRKFAIKCTTGYSLNALVDFPVRLLGIWLLATC